MEGNNSSDYISLEEATRYCPYSQEYLSLRARQGKLKAKKIGRNWLTKKKWLAEYLRKGGSEMTGSSKESWNRYKAGLRNEADILEKIDKEEEETLKLVGKDRELEGNTREFFESLRRKRARVGLKRINNLCQIALSGKAGVTGGPERLTEIESAFLILKRR
jgi:hypothetical protein